MKATTALLTGLLLLLAVSPLVLADPPDLAPKTQQDLTSAEVSAPGATLLVATDHRTTWLDSTGQLASVVLPVRRLEPGGLRTVTPEEARARLATGDLLPTVTSPLVVQTGVVARQFEPGPITQAERDYMRAQLAGLALRAWAVTPNNSDRITETWVSYNDVNGNPLVFAKASQFDTSFEGGDGPYPQRQLALGAPASNPYLSNPDRQPLPTFALQSYLSASRPLVAESASDRLDLHFNPLDQPLPPETPATEFYTVVPNATLSLTNVEEGASSHTPGASKPGRALVSLLETAPPYEQGDLGPRHVRALQLLPHLFGAYTTNRAGDTFSTRVIAYPGQVYADGIDVVVEAFHVDAATFESNGGSIQALIGVRWDEDGVLSRHWKCPSQFVAGDCIWVELLDGVEPTARHILYSHQAISLVLDETFGLDQAGGYANVAAGPGFADTPNTIVDVGKILPGHPNHPWSDLD